MASSKSTERKFTTQECEDFLRRIDAELDGPCEIVLVGGGAVALKFKGSHATTDLDLWSVSESRPPRPRRARKRKKAPGLEVLSRTDGFWGAVGRATSKTAEPVPVQKATIVEPPYSFEDRLTPLAIAGLTKLRILVPEAHDLVLMKIARAEAHDLDAVEDIHKASPLDLDTLVGRYRETTSQVVGSVEMHRLNFLAAVARVFGEQAAERVDVLTARKTGK